MYVSGCNCIIPSLIVTVTLSYTCCCFVIIKMDCFFFFRQLRASPCLHLCYPLISTVQTLAPKTYASAQKSHLPSFTQASSKSTGDISVTLFFCRPWAALMWLCQCTNNPGKWMNSITVPQILSTTMVILLGFMNMAHSVLPFGECCNAHRHPRRRTAHNHYPSPRGSSGSINHRRSSPRANI